MDVLIPMLEPFLYYVNCFFNFCLSIFLDFLRVLKYLSGQPIYKLHVKLALYNYVKEYCFICRPWLA